MINHFESVMKGKNTQTEIVDITFIKNKFKEIHNDYNQYFKTFYKKLDCTFQDTESQKIEYPELMNIIDWFKEYEKMVECTKQTLEDFETEISQKRLELTPERVRDNQIFDEVKDKVMPIAIVYWMALSMKAS
jgi:hypothetical protein